MLSLDAIHSHPLEQQIAMILIKCGVSTSFNPTYNTTNTSNKLLSLQSLCVMSHAMKLLELPCFSAVLFYTQLPIVLHPNDPNIQFISIKTRFATHIRSCFISKIHYQMHITHSLVCPS